MPIINPQYPAGTGYSYEKRISTQQVLGTEPWFCTQQGVGTEYILIHISTQQVLGTEPWCTQQGVGTEHED